jgi:hypothetical protein
MKSPLIIDGLEALQPYPCLAWPLSALTDAMRAADTTDSLMILQLLWALGHAAKSARPIQLMTENPWCSISPAMASGSHECQYPGCDSMTHGNGLPLALFSWGVAFDLKRRPATPPHESRHPLGGRPGPRERGGPRGGPGGSDGGPAPGR